MKQPIEWNTNLYNEKHSFVYQYGEDLIKLLNPQSNERILDLGCGSGQLTNQISQQAREVIGLDNSPQMIEQAIENYPHISFSVGDASNFLFDQPFDSIFSNAALHWVLNYQATIKSIYNNLKPGGKLVLEFGGKGNVQFVISEIKRTLNRNGYIEQSKINPWFFPSISEYSSALEQNGFSVQFAQLYDRPTLLNDSEAGIKDWLTMFGQSFFDGIPLTKIDGLQQEIQDNLKPTCFIDGKWYADYKRLRILAVKEGE